MVKGKLIHPEILSALAYCGHGDKVLISDANYPLDSKTGDGCQQVYLGLTRGTPGVVDVLDAVLEVVNVEKAEVMDPTDGSRPEIFDDFEKLLGDVELTHLERFEFYDTTCLPDVKLAIWTGEGRCWSNILLTIGTA